MEQQVQEQEQTPPRMRPFGETIAEKEGGKQWLHGYRTSITRQKEAGKNFIGIAGSTTRLLEALTATTAPADVSWMVYVKDGIITWELQAVDYPL